MASIVVGVGMTAQAFYVLRVAERVRIADYATGPASDEKLLTMLRSRGMSPATYKAALDLAERSVELRKRTVGTISATAKAQCVGGAGVILLSITALIVLRRNQ